MFRTTILALTAAGSLAALTLAPTSLSALGFTHHHVAVGELGREETCVKLQPIDTASGARLRFVSVCELY